MDYGLWNFIGNFMFLEGQSKGSITFNLLKSMLTCAHQPGKYDPVSSVPPSTSCVFLLPGRHFALQHTASCQDV